MTIIVLTARPRPTLSRSVPQVTQVGNALRLYDADARTARFLAGAGTGISCFATSPANGGMVAYATKGPGAPAVHVHALDSDLSTLGSLTKCGASVGVSALAFSRDGKLLALASTAPDHRLSVRRSDALDDEVANSPLHADAVGIAFNPFNAHDLLVTYTPEGTLSDNPGAAIHAIERAWDKLITTVKHLNVKTAGVAPGSVTAAAWSPNNTVCIGTDGGVLLVCSPHDGQVLAPPGEVTHRVNECFDAGEAKPAGHGHAWAATPRRAPIDAIAFTRRHAVLAGRGGSYSGGSYTGGVALRFHAHPNAKAGATFDREVLVGDVGERATFVSVGGERFESAVVATDRAGIYLVNVEDGVKEGETNTEDSNTENVSSDSTSSSASFGAAEKIGTHHSGSAMGAVALADGAATCGVDGTVRGWDLTTGECAWTIDAGGRAQAACSAGSLANGCDVFAVASAGGVTRVYQCPGGVTHHPKLLLRVRLTKSAPDAFAVSPSGSHVAVAGDEKDGCWFIEVAKNADTGVSNARVVGRVPFPINFGRAVAACWTSDDQLLVAGPNATVAVVTPPATGAPAGEPTNEWTVPDAPSVRSVKLELPLVAIAGSGGKGQFAGIASDRSVRAYALPTSGSTDTLKPDWSKPGGVGKAIGGGLIAAGDAIAVANADGKVSIWSKDRVTSELAAHDSQSGGAVAVVAAPGGRLVTAGGDGAVIVFKTASSFPEVKVDDALVAAAEKARAKGRTHASGPLPDEPRDDPDEPVFKDQKPADAEAETEDTESEVVAVAAADEDDDIPEVAAAKAATLEKVKALRLKLEETIKRNEDADELERIPREDLLIDEKFRDELIAEGDTRVAAAKEVLARDTLYTDYLGAKIKKECWDTMDTHGSAVVGFKDHDTVVYNYPLMVEDRRAVLAKGVAFLRRMEMAEQEYLADQGEIPATDLFDLRVDLPASAGGGGDGKKKKKKTEDEEEEEAAAAAAAAAAKAKASSYESLLYDMFKVYPPRRKITQTVVLRMTTREIRRAFNADYDHMVGVKNGYMDRLGDLNIRIGDIRRELKGWADTTDDGAPVFRPTVELVEIENAPVTVKDSEIKSQRWLSPEDRVKKEAEDAAEAARLAGRGANDPSERALKDMMGGQLENDEAGKQAEELPKPDWMLETDPDDYSDEQKKAAREYDKKNKVFQEDLAKKRRLLDAELRKTRQEAADIVKTWDQELAEFSARKNETDATLARLESWLVACAHEVEVGADDDVRIELELNAELALVTERKATSASAVAEFQATVDAAQKRLDACVEQDKKLETNFVRALGDIDEDVIKKLLNLYKRRKNPVRKEKGGSRASQGLRAAGRRVSRAGAALRAADKLKSSKGADSLAAAAAAMIANPPAQAGGEEDAAAAADSVVLAAHVDPFHGAVGGPAADLGHKPRPPPVDPLDPEHDKSEDIRDKDWEKLVEHRVKKIEKEAELRGIREDMDEIQSYMFRLTEKDAVLQARIDELEGEVAAHAEKRFARLYDFLVPVTVKQGWAEAILPDLTPTGLEVTKAAEADVMLIQRDVVNTLNNSIFKHCEGKVKRLTAIKDFKKGIYDLEWENARLNMEADDLVAKIKELQMTRADSALLPDILYDPLDVKTEEDALSERKKKEMDSLQRRVNHAVKLHARLLADKKKEVQKVRRKIESITAQNEDISLRAAEMRESVSDYERIRDGRGGAAGGKDNNAVAAEKKMRSVVAQSKLQHIARAQAEELAVLQDEVERLRLRTFPSFVERTDTVRLPDIHARPTGRRQY